MKKGFTLIELLAVIVILAVIAVITIPLILGIIEESRVGAFKDSVSLSFSAAELYEAREDVITSSGINVTELDMKNNNFKYGTVIKNTDNQLEVVNVSDGNYCANGVLTNITVYKGSCDTDTPTSPTVAVDNTNYAITKTYILTPPSVISGIARYEYYLSETSTTPESDVTVSGTSTSNEITINVNSKYIYFRVVSVAGIKGLWTNNKINYVDITNPIVSLASSVITSNAVTLVGSASDETSGITKYEFSKDGTNYIDNGTNNIYTFNNLSTGANVYYLRVTNGSGLKSTTSLSAETVTIETPTYSISPSGYATSKTVTINYPSGYTNEYSLNSGTSWITYTTPIVFNANGSVIARVNDGTNYVTGSSYTITNIDTTNPTVSTSVTGKVGTLTLSDNLGLSGYAVTTSTVVPTTWTSISGTSGTPTYTGALAGTYYAWVKDLAGNTAYSSFVLAASSFELIIYDSGNEFSAITGGWRQGMKNTSATSTITKGATYIMISNPASAGWWPYQSISVMTNNVINYTGYKYLNIYAYFNVAYANGMYFAYGPTLLSSDMGDTSYGGTFDTTYKKGSQSITTGYATLTYDISSLTNKSGYISLGQMGNTAYTSIYKIWFSN